eukprot:TRINITY_DN2319_c0_g1_i4.p1 TRINITY_DN2319_c0_g1~~TRINITY_DN2319_c0_g1_i4.p1  ORF type:complete len:504 (+),score=120.33 TRINITY_DN2319_c0_g1_i4:120-1631(+)
MTLAWRAESRKANFGPRLSLVADSMRLRLPRLPLVLLFAVAISTTAIAAASVSALPSGDASLLEKLWLERGTVALDGLVVALFARAGLVNATVGRRERFRHFLSSHLGETLRVEYAAVQRFFAAQLGGEWTLDDWVRGASRNIEGMHGLDSGACDSLLRTLDRLRGACGPVVGGGADANAVVGAAAGCVFVDVFHSTEDGQHFVNWDCIMELDDWTYDLEASGMSHDRQDQIEWCFMNTLTDDDRRTLAAINTCLPLVEQTRRTDHIKNQRKVATALAALRALQQLGLDWFLDHGSLLRFVRGAQTLADDDVDLAVFGEDLAAPARAQGSLARLEQLVAGMRAAGFSHDGNCTGKRVGECDRWGAFDDEGRLERVDYLIFHRGLQHNTMSVSITVYYREGDVYSFYEHWPGFCDLMRGGACRFALRPFGVAARRWQPDLPHEGSIDVRLPEPPEQYLEDLYGDWQTPRDWSNQGSACFHEKYRGLVFEPASEAAALQLAATCR